jgi:hypothetical protein
VGWQKEEAGCWRFSSENGQGEMFPQSDMAVKCVDLRMRKAVLFQKTGSHEFFASFCSNEKDLNFCLSLLSFYRAIFRSSGGTGRVDVVGPHTYCSGRLDDELRKEGVNEREGSISRQEEGIKC